MPIQNGKDKLLGGGFGRVPNVSGAMTSWFQAMTFIQVVKTVVNFKVVESKTEINFMGVWQPASAQSIAMKPEGQRAWKWFTVHAEPTVELGPDEVITYQGTQYRVKSKMDYTEYGYVQYELIEDFTGSGP